QQQQQQQQYRQAGGSTIDPGFTSDQENVHPHQRIRSAPRHIDQQEQQQEQDHQHYHQHQQQQQQQEQQHGIPSDKSTTGAPVLQRRPSARTELLQRTGRPQASRVVYQEAKPEAVDTATYQRHQSSSQPHASQQHQQYYQHLLQQQQQEAHQREMLARKRSHQAIENEAFQYRQSSTRQATQQQRSAQMLDHAHQARRRRLATQQHQPPRSDQTKRETNDGAHGQKLQQQQQQQQQRQQQKQEQKTEEEVKKKQPREDPAVLEQRKLLLKQIAVNIVKTTNELRRKQMERNIEVSPVISPTEANEKAYEIMRYILDEAKNIHYGNTYTDDSYEYRNVALNKNILSLLPGEYFYDVARCGMMLKLLSEHEWRALGIHMSRGWVHYMQHAPEPHILPFRRDLATSAIVRAEQEAAAKLIGEARAKVAKIKSDAKAAQQEQQGQQEQQQQQHQQQEQEQQHEQQQQGERAANVEPRG
ncbi:Cyclin-dependent kinases regulatory subunit (Cell division control protein cks1), partial [Podila epigama]